MNDEEKKSAFVAKTQQGLESLLSEELRNLGALKVVEGRRSVEFECDRFTLYKVLLCSRYAIRVQKVLHDVSRIPTVPGERDASEHAGRCPHGAFRDVQ